MIHNLTTPQTTTLLMLFLLLLLIVVATFPALATMVKRLWIWLLPDRTSSQLGQPDNTALYLEQVWPHLTYQEQLHFLRQMEWTLIKRLKDSSKIPQYNSMRSLLKSRQKEHSTCTGHSKVISLAAKRNSKPAA